MAAANTSRVLLLTGLANGTHGSREWGGSSTVVEIYGTWDTATATVQASSDLGTTWVNVSVAALVGATANVRGELLVIGQGTFIRLVIASGGGSESLTWSVRAYA